MESGAVEDKSASIVFSASHDVKIPRAKTLQSVPVAPDGRISLLRILYHRPYVLNMAVLQFAAAHRGKPPRLIRRAPRQLH